MTDNKQIRNNRIAIGADEARKAFLAVLVLRVVAVLLVMMTLTIRPTLPLWMLEWFGRISWPLLITSVVSLIFHKKTEALINRHPWILHADLLVSVGIIMIGGSWRSSYFGYTITTIILFTLFKGRAGAYFSAFILILAATIKDPSAGMPAEKVFFVSNWDMRMGAALMYTTAGVILGYFSSLLNKIDMLSKQRIEEARKVSAMEEKTRLALELHDGAKQMVNAMLLTLNPLMKKSGSMEKELVNDLRWLWSSMNYLQRELTNVMETLNGNNTGGLYACSVAAIAEEEARISGTVTGFSWDIATESNDILVSANDALPLRRFFSEAYMNAWKHSEVSCGKVELSRSEGSIVVVVSDQGKGFVYSSIRDIGTTGLTSLKYRAEELNGELIVETAPGKGCTLILKVPESSNNIPYRL